MDNILQYFSQYSIEDGFFMPILLLVSFFAGILSFCAIAVSAAESTAESAADSAFFERISGDGDKRIDCLSHRRDAQNRAVIRKGFA